MEIAMNTQHTIVTALLIALTGVVVAADELDLEPCINGGVSALGTHASQYEEDLAAIEERIEELDDLALEPCIDSDVSPDGTAVGSVDAEPEFKVVQQPR